MALPGSEKSWTITWTNLETLGSHFETFCPKFCVQIFKENTLKNKFQQKQSLDCSVYFISFKTTRHRCELVP